MVSPIPKFIKALIEFNSISNRDRKYTRLVIVGSNYSSMIGKDQDWKYHAIKSSQLSLVKFFSLHSDGNFNINMISPATYIKEGAKEYWDQQQLSKKWQKFPTKGLLTSKQVAFAIINQLIYGDKNISGNNIFIDGGLSNLYPDQV